MIDDDYEERNKFYDNAFVLLSSIYASYIFISVVINIDENENGIFCEGTWFSNPLHKRQSVLRVKATFRL